MRLIKTFGLAAMAAIVAMAFVGASSAMATSTVLCKANELVCAVGNVYTGHVEALSTKAVIKGPVTATCEHSIVLGEALGLANPLVIHITLLDFSKCGICTVTVPDKTGLIEALKTASGLATAKSSGFRIVASCTGITCEYEFFAEGAHGLGSPNSTSDATIVATEVEMPLRGGGGFCTLAPAEFTATYNVLLPLPIYISE
jgi:hypothetical protein